MKVILLHATLETLGRWTRERCSIFKSYFQSKAIEKASKLPGWFHKLSMGSLESDQNTFFYGQSVGFRPKTESDGHHLDSSAAWSTFAALTDFLQRISNTSNSFSKFTNHHALIKDLSEFVFLSDKLDFL